MALLDVSDVLDDPDFYDATLQVRQSIVGTDGNGLGQGLSGYRPFVGVVDPTGGKDLVQQGEGDSVVGVIAIYTRFPLSTGDAERGADAVRCQGLDYLVISAEAWNYGSGYTKAYCKLRSLNPTTLGKPNDSGYLIKN